MFGITHAEPFDPQDEDFFAHATSRELTRFPWDKHPPVCRVNGQAGETHVWAPHVVEKDGIYHMFYCGGGKDGDAYQINLRTSTNLTNWKWHESNPLFTDVGNARDPMVLRLANGRYLMYYTRPSDVNDLWSSVAVRESEDLICWSEPRLALVTQRKQRFARLTESPFVFRYDAGEDSAYYLSATGLNGYRDSPVWRSVNPRQFDFDQIVARINAHAPEWVQIGAEAPGYVTHCGWRQGGFYVARVRWEHRPWTVFGLLVVREVADVGELPARIIVRRKDEDKAPYRTFQVRERVASCPLPPGRYRVTVQYGKGSSDGPFSVEVTADERVYLDRPERL